MAEAENQKESNSGRGGRRPGAGRLPGGKNKKTIELETAARGFAGDALKALIHVALKGKIESARVAAACALLDRGYGRPKQSIQHSGHIEGTGVLAIVTSPEDDETWAAGVAARQAILLKGAQAEGPRLLQSG